MFQALKLIFQVLKFIFQDLKHKKHFDRNNTFGVRVFSLGVIFISFGVSGISRSPLYN